MEFVGCCKVQNVPRWTEALREVPQGKVPDGQVVAVLLAAVAQRCVYQLYKYLVRQLGQNIHTTEVQVYTTERDFFSGQPRRAWRAREAGGVGCCATRAIHYRGFSSAHDLVLGDSFQRTCSHFDLLAPAAGRRVSEDWSVASQPRPETGGLARMGCGSNLICYTRPSRATQRSTALAFVWGMTAAG